MQLLFNLKLTDAFTERSKPSCTSVCYTVPFINSTSDVSFRFPVLFYKPTTSLIGPGAPIIIPGVAQPVKHHLPDYEVELVIVIGKPAKDVSQADALDYVLAYSGANDVGSLRQSQ